MNDNDKTKTELVMENVHLRRKMAEAEQKLEWAKGRDGLTDNERRILDMWPRFEDGEPVWFGDSIRRNGNTFTLMDVKFVSDDGEHCGTFLYCEIGNSVFEFSNDPCDRIKRPADDVLDADGVPINVGDTVWSKDGCEAVVTKVDRDRVFTGFEDMFCTAYEPSDLTHREPDSWERLERDATMPPFTYCTRRGIELEVEDGEIAPTNEAFALDIVRRAKALAGIEVE